MTDTTATPRAPRPILTPRYGVREIDPRALPLPKRVLARAVSRG